MSKKKKTKKISNKRAVQNNLYSIGLLWSISKGRIIHTALVTALDYFSWVFYSAFFIRYIINAIEQEEAFSTIFRYIIITGVFFMSSAIYSAYYYGAIETRTRTTVYQKLYQKLFNKARNVDLRCYEDSSFYNRYTLAVEGADEKILWVARNFFGIVFGAIAAIIAFSTIYSIDKLAILFIAFPLVGNFVFGFMVNNLYYQREKEMAPFNRRVDYVNRVMHLADFSKEMRLSRVYYLMKEKYSEAIDGIFELINKSSSKMYLPLWLKNFLTFNIIFEGLLIYGAYRTIISKTMSLAGLAVLSSIMVSATWILVNFANSLLESMRQGLFIENLRTFLEYEAKIPEDTDGIMPDAEIKTIEFRNVSFGYQEDEMTIKNLSFTIYGGKSIALVGHNGAGKSTIIKLLFRLYDPTEGEILLNGCNIKEFNLKAYRKLFAAAFQDYKLISLTIKENVLMRRVTEEDDTTVVEALKKAGVYDKVASLPKGIDTILTKEFDENGVLLSGGEVQKIIVARAFAQQSPVKVFDEPSSALDPIAEFELYDNIRRDSKDKTLIFISHRLSSVRNADMVYMLENGSILEQGSHDELMQMNGAYADMYQKQAKNYLAVEDIQEVIAV